MFKQFKTRLILPIAITILGCAEPPTQEVIVTRAALDGASKAEANIYADKSFQTAQDTLNAALKEIAQQEEKWFKNYDRAKSSLNTARELAQKASTDSETNKATIRKETLTTINKVEMALSELQTSLSNAPRGKGADEDLDRIGSIIEMISTTLTGAQNDLNAGHLKTAQEKAYVADKQMAQIHDTVTNALHKIENWKQKRRSYPRG